MIGTNSLKHELQNRIKHKILLLGIGNENRGDDALGSRLANLVGNKGRIKSMNCGEVPESYTSAVRDYQPDTIVFVDAIDFGGQPGETVVLDKDHLSGKALDTHHVPLRLVMEYVKNATAANVLLIGVQPKTLRYGAGLSPEVARSVETIAELLSKLAANNNFEDNC